MTEQTSTNAEGKVPTAEELEKERKEAKKREGYGKITDEALGRFRDRIGVERVIPLTDWEMEEARLTPMAIRGIAMATGDYNPLYLDADYAAKSPYGTITAPPSVLQMIEQINARTDGMPGMHALFRGLTLEWKRPMRLGELIQGKTYLRVVEVKPSRLSGQAVIQEYESIGTNEKGEVVGTIWTSWSRHERMAAKVSTKDVKFRPLASYSREDLARIREDYKKEKRCGNQRKFWEDVKVGDELAHVVKGPTNLAQRHVAEGGAGIGGGEMSRVGSGGDWGVGHAQVWKLFEKHPGLPYYNEQGIPDVPVTIHNSNERASRYLGLVGGYDAGMQRIMWAGHLLTNWQSDYGFLKKLQIKFPEMTIMGDTTWSRGKVTGKRIEGNNYIIELDIWQENQLGAAVLKGSAEVILPSRGAPGAKAWD